MPYRLLRALLLAGLAALPAAAQPPSPQVTINERTDGTQWAPDVAARGEAGFVAIWRDDGPPAAGSRMRLLDPDGRPIGPEVPIDATGFVRVSSAADGSFVIAGSEGPVVWVRRYDRDGHLRDAGRLQVNPGAVPDQVLAVDVAVAPDGAFVVAWETGNGADFPILARRFAADARPVSDITKISGSQFMTRSNPRAAIAPDGDVLVTWDEGLSPTHLFGRRYDAAADQWTAPFRIDTDQDHSTIVNAIPLLYPDGTAVVVWNAGTDVVAQRLDAAGALLGGRATVGAGTSDGVTPGLAADSRGDTIVSWRSSANGHLVARLYDRSLAPLRNAFPVGDPAFQTENTQAAATPSGRFAIVWDFTHELFSDVGASVLTLPCAAGTEALCLGPNARFQVSADWKNPFTGETGHGRSHPLTSDTGALWFFDPANLELMVKVLDGRALNDHWWVYIGALSNVEYTVTVTDTSTGERRTYHNAPFELASRADVDAFFDGSGAAVEQAAAPEAAGDPFVLPLGGRFQVETAFRLTPLGPTTRGHAVPLTDDTGSFWFFDPANLEMMVKVLDGRSVNGHFWVFFGALSDVDYDLTVTDTQTGQSKTYHNPRGTLASRADVEAF